MAMPDRPIRHRTVRCARMAVDGGTIRVDPVTLWCRRLLLHHMLDAPVPTSSSSIATSTRSIISVHRAHPITRSRSSSDEFPICRTFIPRPILLLELPVRLRLGHHIAQKLQIVDPRYRCRNVLVRDVPTRLALGFHDVVRLFGQVADEDLGGDGDGEGGGVGACGDFVVLLDYLFDARYCEGEGWLVAWRESGSGGLGE